MEEERIPGYDASKFYPVKIGEIFNSRYQVLAKLGYGASSTVWLSRDLLNDAYRALKVCTAMKASAAVDSEVAVSRRLKAEEGEHPGRSYLRTALDDFQIVRSNNVHQCLVFTPMGTTLSQFRDLFPDKVLPKSLVQQTLFMMLLAMDVLAQIDVVHTDISPDNILLGVDDMTVFSKIERLEREKPAPRKILADRTIYQSYHMPTSNGTPRLCDFGAARLGTLHSGDVMPGPYRAPEIIMGLEWDSKVDIWSFGMVAWDLFEGERLFTATKNGLLDDEQHLAEMVSLIGPPPGAFLERSPQCAKYWDEEGQWIASAPIPEQSFESLEQQLDGEDKIHLLRLMRQILQWSPEDRPSAEDLFANEFLAPNNDESTQLETSLSELRMIQTHRIQADHFVVTCTACHGSNTCEHRSP